MAGVTVADSEIIGAALTDNTTVAMKENEWVGK